MTLAQAGLRREISPTQHLSLIDRSQIVSHNTIFLPEENVLFEKR